MSEIDEAIGELDDGIECMCWSFENLARARTCSLCKAIDLIRQELSTLRQQRQARDREVFEAAREAIETYQQEGGYSFNHHRYEKYKTFAEWEASQKK